MRHPLSGLFVLLLTHFVIRLAKHYSMPALIGLMHSYLNWLGSIYPQPSPCFLHPFPLDWISSAPPVISQDFLCWASLHFL